MVISYLEKLQDTYLQEKLEADKKLEKLQIKQKETVAFIALLEETNDPNYESFTPREVNAKNKARILELREEQKDITGKIEEQKISCKKCTDKLKELQEILEQTKKMEKENMEDASKNVLYGVTLLETQENERQRISRDLHDYTIQNLTSLVHKVELCGKLVEMDPVRCKLELSMMQKTLRDIINGTRQMIYDLRPMSFDDIGLDITIERALDKLENSEQKKIQFSVEGEPYQIKPVIGITILRIIQEGCSNAIRYADSSYIKVLLRYEPDRIFVKIEDDGRGFNINDILKNDRKDNSGFGLSIMRERVYLLSGHIEIQSDFDSGTKIFITVPIENSKEENSYDSKSDDCG